MEHLPEKHFLISKAEIEENQVSQDRVSQSATSQRRQAKKEALSFQPIENHSFLHCSFRFLRLAIPTMISCVFLQLTYFINTIFAGHLNDPAKLAGVGLGTTLIGVLCFQPLMGLNGAVETLVS